VARIPFDAGFQMLLAAGLTAIEALDHITHETTRKGGALNLWCNGNPLSWRYIAKYLDFKRDRKGRAKVYPVGSGWEQPIESYDFELDAAQIEALIAKSTGPGRGHPKKHPWEVIDPVIVDEFKLRGTTKKLAYHIIVRLQSMRIPSSPDASQIRKRFKDVLPVEQKRAK
jgi:hypothetical protein